MTDRFKNFLVLLLFLGVMIVLFSPILFTAKIIRAPDILNEFYWGVAESYGKPLLSMLRIDLSTADWNPYINSGHTNNGGMASQQFNYLNRLLFGLIPAPASVAWFMVLHLFLGGCGLYAYCRLVGCSRLASLLGGLVFALAPENVTLINAGHVMKLATIAYTPWVFCFLEKGFRTDRAFAYLCAGMALTFQFFNTHWQIAYYTCLGVAVYVIIRLLSGLFAGEPGRATGRLLLLSISMTIFFLCAVAISLAPLASWSTDTNRGVQSGANQGKGGLNREEAMMWSMPPEEAAALILPGLFGLSRQEGGDKPVPGHVYYWGRMVFTQTTSYFGLLPWLLLPLPFIFRNDRVTKAALVAVFGGLLFAMGKYTPFYQFLYDFFPGINRFRVPKMILFMTALGLGVLAARGLDLLRDPEVRSAPQFKTWLYGTMAAPFVLLMLLGTEKLFGSVIRGWLWELLVRPTRYQPGGLELMLQRWFTIERETGLAVFFSSLTVLVIYAVARLRLAATFAVVALLGIFVSDVWRVNRQFLVLTDLPGKVKGSQTPAMNWIRSQEKGDAETVPLYRALPLGDIDPMSYATARIPVLYTPNAVQKRRWQDYLDNLSFQSAMPDIMNVRWLVYDEKLYERDRLQFGDRYQPVFRGGGEVVLENRQVLPKAWLVSHADVVPDPAQRIKRMQDPSFDPSRTALVESAPPFSLVSTKNTGEVQLERYQGEQLALHVSVAANALLLVGEKYHNGWKAFVDGKPQPIVPVNHVLRGLYLPPGNHTVEYRFDPLPFKIGKWLTFVSFGFFALFGVREYWLRRRSDAAAR